MPGNRGNLGETLEMTAFRPTAQRTHPLHEYVVSVSPGRAVCLYDHVSKAESGGI
jgi:hypothetical protein